MDGGASIEVHGPRPTLAQLARMATARGIGIPQPRGGEFEITLRDARDPRIIIEQIKQKNVITRFARQLMPSLWGWGSLGVSIGFSEEANPASEWLGITVSKLTNSPETIIKSVSPSISGLTYTYSASYVAPSVNRTFRSIFLGINFSSVQGGYVSAPVWWAHEAVLAYTVLTAARTQTTLSTLDIVYRITFAP